MRRALAALGAFILPLLVVFPASADIYGTNIRWDHTDVAVKIHTRDISANRVKTGIKAWDVTNLSPKVTGGSCLDSAGVPQGCIDIADGVEFNDPSWAAAAERYTLADGTIYGCTIQYSSRVIDRAGSSWRTVIDDIGSHEGGHCFGHAHTSDPSIPSVMQPIVKNWNGLQQYDIDEDRILYPFVDTSAAAVSVSRSQLKVEKFIIKF